MCPRMGLGIFLKNLNLFLIRDVTINRGVLNSLKSLSRFNLTKFAEKSWLCFRWPIFIPSMSKVNWCLESALIGA